MDVSTLHQSAGRLNRTLQPLVGISDKVSDCFSDCMSFHMFCSLFVWCSIFMQSVLLAEEVKKLSSLIQIAEGAAYESEVIPLMSPALDTIQHTEDQVGLSQL